MYLLRASEGSTLRRFFHSIFCIPIVCVWKLYRVAQDLFCRKTLYVIIIRFDSMFRLRFSKTKIESASKCIWNFEKSISDSCVKTESEDHMERWVKESPVNSESKTLFPSIVKLCLTRHRYQPEQLSSVSLTIADAELCFLSNSHQYIFTSLFLDSK